LASIRAIRGRSPRFAAHRDQKPLDGSRIADWLMPRSLRPAWEQFAQYWPFALAAVIILPRLWGISLFAWPLHLAGQLIALLVHLLGG
jgi:hypothetical protein